MKTCDELIEERQSILKAIKHPFDELLSVNYFKDTIRYTKTPWVEDYVSAYRDSGSVNFSLERAETSNNPYKASYGYCSNEGLTLFIFSRLEHKIPKISEASDLFKKCLKEGINKVYSWEALVDKEAGIHSPSWYQFMEKVATYIRCEFIEFIESIDIELWEQLDLSESINQLYVKNIGSDYQLVYNKTFEKEFSPEFRRGVKEYFKDKLDKKSA